MATRTRGDDDFTKKHGLRKAFFLGHNSTCRQHIRQHWPAYKTACDASGIKPNHHCIPRDILKELGKSGGGKKGQRSLDLFLASKPGGPREFSRETILELEAKHIVCDDQVCMHMRHSLG